MQSLHVRFIFQLSIPLHGDFQGGYSFNLSQNGIGITLKNQNSLGDWHYELQLLSCDGGLELDATKCLTWAKRNSYTLQTKANASIEGLILRLKIKHGVFDFRKVKKRAIRFNVNCFHSGVFVGRGTSEICQLLPKKRKADDSDMHAEVLVPIIWTVDGNELPQVQVNNEQIVLHSSDEERPKKRQRVTSYEQQQLLSEDSTSSRAVHSTAIDYYEMGVVYESPDSASANAELSPYYAHPSHIELAFNNSSITSYHEVSLEDVSVAREHEQYMVLYNGNAEVVGNFRALNFYKASDINIKEDIRLLVEDRDPRDVIMKIDGVEYKFKDHVQHSTNKRFVGYIAQQIESVVPEAVQLIDGILHVDYESLIPYLSESIKQNFSDINRLKSQSERIRKLLDSLYSEFISKQSRNEEKVYKATPRTSDTRPTSKWLIPLMALVFVIGAAVGVFFFLNSPNANTPLAPAQINSINNNTTPYVYSHDRDTLMKLFMDLNGPNWRRKLGWGSDDWHCGWEGIMCENSRVVSIHLTYNNLVGTIPEVIGDLDKLSSVNMASNNLQGTIPSSLWLLKNIEEIILSKNKKLTGTISSHERRSLNLDLSGCNIQGTIPPVLLYDTISHFINLSSNALTGTIPPMSFYNTILSLDLSHNQLEGTIPYIGASSKVILSHNKLSGDLNVFKFSSLKELDVGYNNLNGLFWYDEDDEPPNLAYIDLSHNKFNYSSFHHPFNYTIPICDASKNEFRCPIPDWFATQCNAVCG